MSVALLFERRAQLRAAMVKQDMLDAVEALRVVIQLFFTDGNVTPEQFHSFTQPLQARYSYIEAFGFYRLVAAAQISSLGARIHVNSLHFAIDDMVDGKWVVAGVKEIYRVVEYIEPMKGNEEVFIVDSSSLPFQNEAVQRVEDSGFPSATGLLRFFKAEGEQRGFLIMMAVNRDGATNSVALLRLVVVGYTVAMLHACDTNVSVSIDRAIRIGHAADPPLLEASDQADMAIETIRHVISDLRPRMLDQLGAWAALEWHAERIQERTGLQCICSIHESASRITLDPERSTMLFPVVQEALPNVVRHAGATQVMIGISHEKKRHHCRFKR